MTVDSDEPKIALDVSRTLDARGLACPLPLLKTKLELNGMRVNDILHVMATDAGSQRDMLRFSELSGNELIASETLDSEFHYWLRKR